VPSATAARYRSRGSFDNADHGRNIAPIAARAAPDESIPWFSDNILVILLDISGGSAVTNMSQKRAIKNYRRRLNARGMVRFEVLGRDADRELIRSLAKRLAEDGPDATRIRAAMRRTVSGEPPKKGGILAALRRSPLVGADLDVSRSVTQGRKVDL
jgi:hypothetical protein